MNAMNTMTTTTVHVEFTFYLYQLIVIVMFVKRWFGSLLMSFMHYLALEETEYMFLAKLYILGILLCIMSLLKYTVKIDIDYRMLLGFIRGDEY